MGRATSRKGPGDLSSEAPNDSSFGKSEFPGGKSVNVSSITLIAMLGVIILFVTLVFFLGALPECTLCLYDDKRQIDTTTEIFET